jgi:hypothetical protein
MDMPMNDHTAALSALKTLNPGCQRDAWIRIGMAAKSAGITFDDFLEWSKNADNYKNEKDCRDAWNSFKDSGGITQATLFGLARQQGWRPNLTTYKTKSSDKRIAQQIESKDNSPNLAALEIWERCLPATPTHPYIQKKNGNPEQLKYYPPNEKSLIINDEHMANYLVVPCWDGEHLQTLQFISPDTGKKLNLPKAQFNNGYLITGTVRDTIYICEGIGQAWAILNVVEAAAVVTFGATRTETVSKILRTQYTNANLIIVSDRGKENKASEIATSINCQYIKLPEDKPSNYDVNDYLIDHGKQALSELLTQPVITSKLDVTFATDLPSFFSPHDEIIEGILTNGDSSVIYGDSNSGKTFLAIDMGCALARGIPWMNRNTEAGLVIYLAAESPSSIKMRLQAYQKYHKVRVPNFAIVLNPIDFFNSNDDTEAVIHLIRELEKKLNLKARLVIGDTLARISAGANENAGQDMGLIVQRIDRIRTECKVHFNLIHHTGKNVSSGARGWSGLRAAIDTEIEITDSPEGRCAEITKQRDLDTKGIRIGFKLETVSLGLTKWKAPATSCIVVSAEAPKKQPSVRMSEIAGAIMEYVNSCTNPIKKMDIVNHLSTRYKSASVYREIKKLVNARRISFTLGCIQILVPTNAD